MGQSQNNNGLLGYSSKLYTQAMQTHLLTNHNARPALSTSLELTSNKNVSLSQPKFGFPWIKTPSFTKAFVKLTYLESPLFSNQFSFPLAQTFLIYLENIPKSCLLR